MLPSTNPDTLNVRGGKPLLSEFAADPDMRELIELFVSEMPERIASLETLWRDRQLEPLKRLAHQLKGAGGGYGFSPVSSAAGTLEETIKSVMAAASPPTSLAAVQQQVEELISICRRVSAGG
jgi:HPt (histidine-containing phosphotransfer) domain-containing protein